MIKTVKKHKITLKRGHHELNTKPLFLIKERWGFVFMEVTDE